MNHPSSRIILVDPTIRLLACMLVMEHDGDDPFAAVVASLIAADLPLAELLAYMNACRVVAWALSLNWMPLD